MKRKNKKNKNKNAFHVLALDPSLTAFGYVILTGNKIITQGCIKTAPASKKLRIRKGDDRINRISEINHILKSIISKYGVNYIVSELPHGSQSAVAAIALGLVSGTIQGMADFLDIGLEWFSEGDCKKCALQKRSAAKYEMINRMDEIYNVKWTGIKFRDEAVADALSVHYTASHFSPILKARQK